MSSKPRVIGIGEVLWDQFPDGDRLGGAPANFAFHAGQLGAKANIVSRVGRDASGDRLSDLLSKRGLTVESLQRDEAHVTGAVRVELSNGQPTYVIENPVAWDYLQLSDDLFVLAGKLDAVCFGSLAQRNPVSRQTIQDFVKLCPKTTLRLFDVNLRQNFYTASILGFGLSQASVVKLNGDELAQVANLFQWPSEMSATVARIFEQFPVEVIAVTLGAQGCKIFTREKHIAARAPEITCVDAVGAGDAFAAALTLGLLAHQPLEDVAHKAVEVGAFVASQAGAMAELPSDFKIL